MLGRAHPGSRSPRSGAEARTPLTRFTGFDPCTLAQAAVGVPKLASCLQIARFLGARTRISAPHNSLTGLVEGGVLERVPDPEHSGRLGVRFQAREPMTPLTPAERDALRLRAEKADEVFSGRTVGELILDVRKAHADASAGLLGAALDAILAECMAEPFEPWPGSLVAALVASCAT